MDTNEHGLKCAEGATEISPALKRSGYAGKSSTGIFLLPSDGRRQSEEFGQQSKELSQQSEELSVQDGETVGRGALPIPIVAADVSPLIIPAGEKEV